MPPALLLRLEGAALFFCGIFFYHSLGAGWILFVTLCLWPDISMLGYLVNPKLGSRLYNLVHTEVLPAALAASSFALHRTSLLAFALIWLCHIGFDRLIGAGLKYPYVLQRHPSTASVKASLRKARNLEKGLEEVTPLTRSQVDAKRAIRTSGSSKIWKGFVRVLSSVR
jgi:hypothetical protein